MKPLQSLAERSLIAVKWGFIGSSGRLFAQFFVQIALARMLGPEAFGQYSAVLVVLGIGWLLADSGLGAALIQKQKLDQSDVEQALGWVLIIASLTSGITYLSATWLASQFSDTSLVPMFQTVSLFIFLQAFSNISLSLLRRRLDMKLIQFIQVGSYLAGFGFIAMILANFGYGGWSLVIGFGVQTFISLIASYYFTRHSLRPRLFGNRCLQVFGIKVVATNVVNWAIENLDRFLVGKFWGIHALGLYSVAFNVSRAPAGALIGSIQTVAFSSASSVQDDREKIRKYFLALISLVALLMFPVCAIISIEAGVVIDLIYGGKWNEAAPLFSAFAIATPIYGLAALTGTILWSLSAVEKEFQSQLIVCALLLIGFVILRDTPIFVAVWLVPFAYVIRFLLLALSLSNLLNITVANISKALAGGVVLALFGTSVGVFVRLVWGNGADWLRDCIKTGIQCFLSKLLTIR